MKAIFALAMTFLMLIDPLPAKGDEQVIETKSYLILLRPSRADFLQTVTPDEQAVLGAHFVRLQKLQAEGKLLLAGPCEDAAYGLVIVRTTSEDEAKGIMADDPAVKAGIFTAELHPYIISLGPADWRGDGLQTQIPVSGGRKIVKDTVVAAPVAEVYRLWTTKEGLEEFFAAQAKVQLTVGGPYEILFSLDAPVGERGSEGCRVLSYLENKFVSFTWNAPPKFGEMRKKHTYVVVEFEPIDAGQTRVRLTHQGWGEGPKWDEVYNYFDNAWGYVFGAMDERIKNGPPKK